MWIVINLHSKMRVLAPRTTLARHSLRHCFSSWMLHHVGCILILEKIKETFIVATSWKATRNQTHLTQDNNPWIHNEISYNSLKNKSLKNFNLKVETPKSLICFRHEIKIENRKNYQKKNCIIEKIAKLNLDISRRRNYRVFRWTMSFVHHFTKKFPLV